MLKKFLLIVLLSLVTQVLISCSKDDDVFEDEETPVVPDNRNDNDNDDNDDNDDNNEKEEQNGDDFWEDLSVSLYSNNSRNHQSSAAYGDYAFFVTDKRGTLHFYNLRTKQLICSKNLGAMNEKIGSYILYHCNQTTFGTSFYNDNDSFPLLYISQRARSDERCFVEVFRLMPHRANENSDFTDIDAELVQTIYFPVQTKQNALGRINCAIDAKNNLLYTYSYSTITGDANRGQCRISCFRIPDIYEKDVYLEDSSILYSYAIDYYAVNSQGGCIKDDKLFITQGFKSVGIYLNIIDLKKRKLAHRIDLLELGVTWEPEGCFVFDDNIMVSSSSNIWEFDFQPVNNN